MKRLSLVLAVLTAATIVATGCEATSHGRHRQMTYRRVIDADVLGFEDDVDSALLLSERPTHLSQWYHW